MKSGVRLRIQQWRGFQGLLNDYMNNVYNLEIRIKKVNEEITEILLMIYKRLKEDEDMESINRLLLFLKNKFI